MRSYVKFIGVTDKADQVHAVEFGPGVNVVTGKSSTGKSALIEIFDYCFGSSDFTVPEGVITERAEIYFVVLNVEGTFLVLGRTAETGKVFLKEEFEEDIINNPDSFVRDYFETYYFFPLSYFKKELGRYFDLNITDVDEDLQDREFRYHKRKKETPSVRSFTSLMLQHQNLVANKHAIFYRFDERAKREQVIDHMKIFLGFADQEYFIKSQKLNELKVHKRTLEAKIPREQKQKENNEIKFNSALKDYTAVSGHALEVDSLKNAVDNPARALNFLRETEVKVVAVSDEHQKLKSEIDRELATRTASLRAGQQKLADIQASISFAKNYDEIAERIVSPDEADIKASQCPFCHSHHANIENAANRLTDALGWLNDELGRSRYHLEAFEEDENKQKKEVEKLKSLVLESSEKSANLTKQIAELAKNKTQFELAIKAKIQMESLLEGFLEQADSKLKSEIEKINKEIKELENDLYQDYNIPSKMRAAEAAVRSHMKAISEVLEFEASYRPVNLEFSFETFDLWNTKDMKKIFLRSMGSGANWLSSHVTLFLGLQRYFCQLGPGCKIPTVLFLDQPSQVYFPSILDSGTEFRPKELAALEGDRKRSADEDVEAVTNLYSQLVKYCQDTFNLTRIMPQIIVTDHADSLELDGDILFEDLVRARWRTRGFIEES